MFPDLPSIYFYTPIHTPLRLTFMLFGSARKTKHTKQRTTVSNGYLGSRNDEERSEMRYVMRIAEFSESSNL